jgi:hypothetical protein
VSQARNDFDLDALHDALARSDELAALIGAA